MIIVEKSWGREEILHNGDYCCKKLVYTKRIASSLHYHEKKHETFVVLSGEFELETSCEPYTRLQRMLSGDYCILPPRTQHRVRCIRTGTILESSTYDDPEDCVRLILSES